jgi:hypothetical protein
LELEGDRRPSSFYLGHFSSSKNLNHIIKDVNIFHIKSNNSHRVSYFPTSTLPNTLHITTADLLQAIDFWHVNMTDLPQVVDYEHEKIFTTTLSQLDLMSLRPFPSFHSFLYVSLIYSVFFLVKLSRNLLRI